MQLGGLDPDEFAWLAFWIFMDWLCSFIFMNPASILSIIVVVGHKNARSTFYWLTAEVSTYSISKSLDNLSA